MFSKLRTQRFCRLKRFCADFRGPSVDDIFLSSETEPNHTVVASPSFYDSTIDRYCKKKSHQQSLLSYKNFGKEITEQKLLTSARYVQRELPIRLARELKRLQTLPWIMMTNPHIEAVHHQYWTCLQNLISFPTVNTQEDDIEFTKLLKTIVQDTTVVVERMAHGVSESRRRLENDQVDIQGFLDAFLISRIARRVLVEQHIMLHYEQSDRIGIISPTCSPYKTIMKILPQVNTICDQAYGTFPLVEVSGSETVTIPYITQHLEYILTEILKNAFRATVEERRKQTGLHFPVLSPVNVLIAPSEKYVTLRISDNGGGIPVDIQDKIWRYGFTTAKDDERSTGNLLGQALNLSPIAGLGFGLPLSRLYAKHFGGDLKIVVLEGYGTDVHLRLDRTGSVLEAFDFCE